MQRNAQKVSHMLARKEVVWCRVVYTPARKDYLSWGPTGIHPHVNFGVVLGHKLTLTLTPLSFFFVFNIYLN